MYAEMSWAETPASCNIVAHPMRLQWVLKCSAGYPKVVAVVFSIVVTIWGCKTFRSTFHRLKKGSPADILENYEVLDLFLIPPWLQIPILRNVKMMDLKKCDPPDQIPVISFPRDRFYCLLEYVVN